MSVGACHLAAPRCTPGSPGTARSTPVVGTVSITLFPRWWAKDIRHSDPVGCKGISYGILSGHKGGEIELKIGDERTATTSGIVHHWRLVGHGDGVLYVQVGLARVVFGVGLNILTSVDQLNGEVGVLGVRGIGLSKPCKHAVSCPLLDRVSFFFW